MEEPSERKRSNSALIPILIVAAVICIGGLIIVGVIAAGAIFFLGVAMPSSVISGPAPAPVMTVTTAAVPVPVNPSSTEGGLLDQVAAGEVEVENVSVARPGETIGPLLSVEVSNPGEEAVDARIACGTIFEPVDSGEQRLMAIQETMVTVSPGETADLDAYVACIDADRKSPSGQGDYSAETLADGRLLVLANCLCAQDIQTQADADPMRAMTVQFAVWSVSNGIDLNAPLEGTATGEGALGEFFSGPMGEMLEPFLKNIVEETGSILSECGVAE